MLVILFMSLLLLVGCKSSGGINSIISPNDANNTGVTSSPSVAPSPSKIIVITCPPGEWMAGDSCDPIPEPDDSLDLWVQTGGPPAGGDHLVEIDSDGTIYVAALGGGLFRSSDGETWSLTNVFIPRYGSIIDLQIEPTNPQTLWVQTVNGTTVGPLDQKLFKSNDKGDSWSEVSGISNVLFTGPFAVSPTVSGSVIASTEDGRIYISTNGGTSWTERPIPLSDQGLEPPMIRAVAAASADEFWVSTVWGNNRLFHTTNSGVDWTLEPTIAGATMPNGYVSDILVDPADDRRIYVAYNTLGEAAAGNINMARTDDAGAIWQDITVNYHGTVRIIGQSGDTIFAANGLNIVRSNNRGAGWEPFVGPFSASDAKANDPSDIAVDPDDPNTIYIPSNGLGIAKSTDGGRTWRHFTTGLNAADVPLVTVLGEPAGGLIASGSRGVFRSYDWGETWTRLPLMMGQVDEIAVSAQNTNRVWVVADAGTLFTSDDRGESFDVIYEMMGSLGGFRYGSIYAFSHGSGSPQILYAVKSGFGIWRSADGGDRWRFLQNSEIDYSYSLAVDQNDANIIFSGYNPKPFETEAKIRRSLDGGNSWDTPLTIEGSSGVTSVVIDPEDSKKVYAGSASTAGGQIWQSHDSGTSFSAIGGLTFANVHAFSSHPGDTSRAIAALWGGGTYITDDSGETWTELVEPPTVSSSAVLFPGGDPANYYLADRASPKIFRASGPGVLPSWSVYFDAGENFYRVLTAALAPSDSTVIYASIFAKGNPMAGSLFRINNGGGVDITDGLPTLPSAIAVHQGDANTVYVVCHGAGSGVFKSMNGGESWTNITGQASGIPQLPAIGYNGIVIDPHNPETVYLFGGSDAYFNADRIESTGADASNLHTIYRSLDGGATWLNLNDGNLGSQSGPIKGMVVSQSNRDLIFAAAQNGMFRSIDGGTSWESVNSGLNYTNLAGVALSANSLTIYAPTLGGGVFTGDVNPGSGDVTWENRSTLTSPVFHVQVAVQPGDSNTLIASAYPGGIFKSKDGGGTWAEANFGLPTIRVDDPIRQGYYVFTMAPSQPEVIYLGIFGRGIYKSDNGADTWLLQNGSGDTMDSANVSALLVSPTDAETVWASTDSGVFKTIDGGNNWTDISSGLGNPDVRNLSRLSDGTLIAGTRGDELYRLDEGTSVWKQMPPLADLGQPWLMWGRGLYQYTSVLFHPDNPDIVYIGTFPTGIYKTEDGGATWREKNVGFTNDGIFYITFKPDDPEVIYAGTYNGVNRSMDGGEHWEKWDQGWPGEQWVFDIAFDPRSADVMYACSLNGQNKGIGVDGFHGTVMKSTNGGELWTEIISGLPDQQFYSIEVNPETPDIIYLAGELGVYRSTNAGESWVAWSEGLLNPMASHPNNVTKPLDISQDGRYLFFGSDGSGLFRRRIAP